MRRITAVLSAMLLLLVVGCGSDANAAERIAAAPEITSEGGSARMAMKMTMAGGAQNIEMTAEGAVEFATQRGTMTMDMGAATEQMGGKIEMITDGSTIYMKMPNAEQLGLKTPWMKMDMDALTGTPGMGNLQQLNNDPSNSMQLLRGVADDVEEVGTEELRGAQTTHYKATIDLNKALEEAPKDAQEYLRQQFETAGITQLPVDVWIDDEGRMRRQSFEMDLSKIEGADAPGAPTSMTLDMELFDFGAPVDVKPPPAKDVTDFADIQGAGG